MFKLVKKEDLIKKNNKRKVETYEIKETREFLDLYDLTLELVSLARDYEWFRDNIDEQATNQFYDEMHTIHNSIKEMNEIVQKARLLVQSQD